MNFVFSKCWIVNQDVDPKDDRVIMLIWDRNSKRYKIFSAAVLHTYSPFLTVMYTKLNIHQLRRSITLRNLNKDTMKMSRRSIMVLLLQKKYLHKKKRVIGIGIKIVLSMN